MRLTRLHIRHVLGHDDLIVEPGKVTTLTGGNATGKTSVLRAIVAMLGGGHDARLIRDGADKGEVVAVLDDGTEIAKRITGAGSRVEVTRAGAKVASPQAAVNELVAAHGLNPLAALEPARRRDFLLEVLDARLDRAALVAMLGGAEPPPVSYDRHALLVLDDVYRYLFARRQEAGRVKRAKEAAADEGRQALPPEPPPPAEARDAAERRIEAARERVAVERSKGAALEQKRLAAKGAEVAVAEVAARVRKLEAALAAAREDLARAEAGAEAARAAVRGEEPDQAVIAAAEAEQNVARESLVAHEARRAHQSQVAHVRALEGASEEAAATWGALDGQVTAVGPEAQTRWMAARGLPTGLAYAEGGFRWQGRPIETLSQSEVLRLAVRLVKLSGRDRPLKLMLLDGIECLDAASLEALAEEQAPDDGWQYVVTRVTEGPLRVEVAAPVAVATEADPLAEDLPF